MEPGEPKPGEEPTLTVGNGAEKAELEAAQGLEETERGLDPAVAEGEAQAAFGPEGVGLQEVPEAEWRARFQLLTLCRPQRSWRPSNDRFMAEMTFLSKTTGGVEDSQRWGLGVPGQVGTTIPLLSEGGAYFLLQNPVLHFSKNQPPTSHPPGGGWWVGPRLDPTPGGPSLEAWA